MTGPHLHRADHPSQLIDDLGVDVPRTGAALVIDDFGSEVERSARRIVIDDFGVEVTGNPIWAEQRLDPHLAVDTNTKST